MDHSASQVVLQLLLDRSQVAAANSGDDWEVGWGLERDGPDNSVTVFNTDPKDDGDVMTDGDSLQQFGIMLRVRSADQREGWKKASELSDYLAKGVLRAEVELDGVGYFIQCFSNIVGPLDNGYESPTSLRFIHTVNAYVNIDQLPQD